MTNTATVPARQNSAQTITGRAILLEIGSKLGVLDTFLTHKEISVADVAKESGVAPPWIASYYAALSHAGLARPGPKVGGEVTHYHAAPDLQQSINDVGYVLWGLGSCAPLIANAVAFAKDLPTAANLHVRDGEHVARTSRWMGEQDFYPQAEAAILASSPRKIVDLGSGTCGLLLRCLRKLPESRGVGIDLSHDACVKARSIVQAAGMDSRVSVIEAPIQSLVNDPSPVEGADVIHGGFVFHDLMPDEEATLNALLKTFRVAAPKAAVIVVDAVPYGPEPDEHAFSAAFTFLHSHFMARRLQPESEWKQRLTDAGFPNVSVSRLGISGGRIFTARAA
ncbi:class I SAM-dependent methyltransferase [Myxococcus stipitatus]|uniref:class I SAM-dependent methyltransferase n=1 Tax=Myxococcus stipitatus TaxID=83455 RepID=UPI0030CD29DA